MPWSAASLWIAETFINSKGTVDRRLYALMIAFWICMFGLAAGLLRLISKNGSLFDVADWAFSVMLIAGLMSSLSNLTTRRFRDAGYPLKGRYKRLAWTPLVNILFGLGLSFYPSVSQDDFDDA